MDRLVNYAFLLLLIYLFVLQATPDERIRLGIALAISICFSILAFLIKWLTMDGAIAASLFGGIVLGFGDWPAAVLILIFFLTSTLISQKSIVRVEETHHMYVERVRRDGLQVWANGFWFALFVLLAFLVEWPILWIGAAGSIAVAASDTWATELGSKRFRSETYLFSNFRKVEPGTDGGISLPGTLGAVGGSLLIAAAAVYLYSFSWVGGVVSIFAAGFSGCLLDSYLGATLQRKNKTISFGSQERSIIRIHLDNNFVNWAATGFGSLAAITINLLIV